MKQDNLHPRKMLRYRALFGVAIFAFLFGLYDIGAGLGMRMDQNGSMQDCISMHANGEGLCPMKVADHVTSWRLLFGSLPQSELLIIVFTMMLSLAAVAGLVLLSTPSLLRFLWYERARVHQRLFAPLQLALARGIVHPKNYA